MISKPAQEGEAARFEYNTALARVRKMFLRTNADAPSRAAARLPSARSGIYNSPAFGALV